MNFLYALDRGILDFLSVTLKNSFFDFLMPIITTANNHGEIWILIALVLIFNKKKEVKRIGFTMLVALVIGYAIGEGCVKNIVQRHRPTLGIESYKFLVSIPTSYSFPSGHTTSSFAAAGVIWVSKAKYRIWALMLAIVIAFSRMYLHVHYPSDVLGGIVLGLACAYASVHIVKYIVIKREGDKNYGRKSI
jgi:undecaprenyl-diphosphatase